jgi:cytidyltransferase-like protein
MLKKKNKKVLVDMSASILHHGHINLLKKASKFGDVIVALTRDVQIKKKKGYYPILNFKNRSTVIRSIKYVHDVVPSNWNIDDKFIKKHKIEILVHGSDNSNTAKNVKVITFKRTKGVSSTNLRKKILK